jgi:hypothetical protein
MKKKNDIESCIESLKRVNTFLEDLLEIKIEELGYYKQMIESAERYTLIIDDTDKMPLNKEFLWHKLIFL